MKPIKSKMITCILTKGKGRALIDALRKDKGITTANMNSARGIGTSTATDKKSLGQPIEKDVLTTIVPEEISEDIFHYIYDTAKIGEPHGGFLFMAALQGSVPFELPQGLPEEKS